MHYFWTLVDQNLSCRWSEFIALLSLSTTFFLFLQSRDLSMQLNNERRRIAGEERHIEDNSPQNKGDSPDIGSAQERENFRKVKHNFLETKYFQLCVSLTLLSWTTPGNQERKSYFLTEYQKLAARQPWSWWSLCQPGISSNTTRMEFRKWRKSNCHSVRRWVGEDYSPPWFSPRLMITVQQHPSLMVFIPP